MSVDLSIRAYAGKDSPEFQKHYKAVKFCIENGLSYPKETSNFFKGKIDGDDLEDQDGNYILESIENGIEVDLKLSGDDYVKTIKVSEIPKEVDIIVITLD
jgi:hypothetical protein